MFGVILGGDFQ